MKTDKYYQSEIYYNDGGHCGPFVDFHSAYVFAIKTIRGSKTTRTIEIRPPDSDAIGGYAPGHDGSFYVTQDMATWSSAR